MGDTPRPREPGKRPTFEDVWAMFQETDRQLQEVGRFIKESAAETDKRIKATIAETDKRIEATIAETNKRIEATIAETDKRIEATIAETDKRIEATIAETDKRIVATIAETDKRIVATIAETDKRIADTIAETDKWIVATIAETDKRLAATTAETDKRIAAITAKTDKQIETMSAKTDKHIGRLSSRLGEIIEHLMSPKLKKKFEALGYSFDHMSRNHELEANKKRLAEIDVLLENGEYALAVEVKTHLTTDDVQDHVKRMDILRRVADDHNDKRKYLGAVAGAVIDKEVFEYARKNGFYLINPSGDTVDIEAPKGFKPRIW
ncbi:MAG: hypothetical protein LBQ57_12170 [Spirochaetales bacterium]|jgi:ElaB/YqjD/DUF883 family membrane-anchored ribosome-binding protein|nr:hypothetical protein [Spirochaetales bacterium]